MGNTCATSAASSTQEFADAGRQQQGRVAVIDDSAVETIILLDSESAAATDDDEQSPRRRSKGRKGTGFVRKGDLDEEQLREVQMQLPEEEMPEGESEVPTRKKGGRKATGFVFKEKLQELSQGEDDGDGYESDADEQDRDAEEEDRKKVLFNEEANETLWLKDKEEEEQEGEEHCWKRTSERKSTGKAIQLSPQDLDEIHQRVHFEREQQEDELAAAAAAGAAPASNPVLLAAPAPKRRGRKPTGRPTERQIAEVRRRQEADEVQSPREASPSPAPRRQKVRKDTGHPTADSKRTRARRALGRLFRA